jgi:arylsulfatase A-like enzyme
MVTDLDRQLGRVLDGMDPELRSQTVVIVVGDNGSTDNSAMGDYVGKPMKSHVHEGGIHVPLVIAGPIVASPGRNESSLVALPDLFATIVDLADGDPGAIDGRSLLSVLRDETSSARQWSFATAFEPNGPGPYTLFEQTIRGQRYKLIRDRSGDTLYDLTLSDLEGNDSKVKRKRSVEQWSGYRKILDGCFPRDIK